MVVEGTLEHVSLVSGRQSERFSALRWVCVMVHEAASRIIRFLGSIRRRPGKSLKAHALPHNAVQGHILSIHVRFDRYAYRKARIAAF